MSRKIIIMCLIFFISSCVSTHMKQFIGKDIREVYVDSGLPVNQFDMGDGRMAYQYYWGGGSFYMPQTTTQQGTVNVIGNTGYFNSTAITSGGNFYKSEGCLITYFARKNNKTNAWIVEEIAYPDRLFC